LPKEPGAAELRQVEREHRRRRRLDELREPEPEQVFRQRLEQPAERILRAEHARQALRQLRRQIVLELLEVALRVGDGFLLRLQRVGPIHAGQLEAFLGLDRLQRFVEQLAGQPAPRVDRLVARLVDDPDLVLRDALEPSEVGRLLSVADQVLVRLMLFLRRLGLSGAGPPQCSGRTRSARSAPSRARARFRVPS
jgi:hypothetical protein